MLSNHLQEFYMLVLILRLSQLPSELVKYKIRKLDNKFKEIFQMSLLILPPEILYQNLKLIFMR